MDAYTRPAVISNKREFEAASYLLKSSHNLEKALMSENFDEFVEDLQNQIFEETRAAYGDIAFQRWLKPLYMGSLNNPDGYGRVTGSCGDTMQIFLKIMNNKIQEALFQTDGCGSSAVCGSFAAELCRGKTPDEILEISGESILKKTGGLPKEDEHCAFLAAAALQEALNDYMVKQKRKG
jgi:nitrogen fixation NifU-like protein